MDFGFGKFSLVDPNNVNLGASVTTTGLYNSLNVIPRDASGNVIGQITGYALEQGGNLASIALSVAPLRPLNSSTAHDFQLTLTNANAAYSPTAEKSTYELVMCNNSDTDMKWNFAGSNSIGILLAKSGGSIALVLAANKSVTVWCGSAGKVLDYTTSVIV
jgi:hypothetical protein